MSLENLFHEEIGNFFRKVEDRREVESMQNYGRSIIDIILSGDLKPIPKKQPKKVEKVEVYELIENEEELRRMGKQKEDKVKYYRKCEQEKLKLVRKGEEQNREQGQIINLLKKVTELEDKEYMEKVKGYTMFATDRKLSGNISTFEEEEIENGKIDLKSSALIRVVTKWCKELANNFNSLSKRKKPFRMMDGSLKFLESVDLDFLQQILDREQEKVN